MDLDDAWQTVVSVALVGTERQPFTYPTTTGKLGQLLSQSANHSTEAALLITAATLSLYQRAGQLPEKSVASVFKPEQEPPFLPNPLPDNLPRCGSRATSCLQQILHGQYPQLLPEWLSLAANAGQRIPELYLPELLDLGKQQRGLRTALLAVLGQRGRWLTMQNPDWSYATAVTTEADWETGNTAARMLCLLDTRTHNPAHARALLQATWSQEAASDRAQFLETLRVGLSMADEPFLTAGLSDRSKEVRRVAADLLSRLPDSHLCQTVAAQTIRYLTITTEVAKPGQSYPPQKRLNVELPTALDPALIQYGIDPKPPRRSANLGEKAWWLLQMLGATPLTIWQDWGIPPAHLIQLAKHHEWEAVLLEGWALAATRQQNSDWVEALLDRWVAGKGTVAKTVLLPELGLEALLDSLPTDRQNAFLINFLQSGRADLTDSLTIWLLRHSRSAWSIDLGTLVLEQLETHFNHHQAATNLVWELRTALKEFAQSMPTALTGKARELQTRLVSDSLWQQSVEEFLALLQFRAEMKQAFQL